MWKLKKLSYHSFFVQLTHLFFQSDTTLEIEKMDKANATWSDELAPAEAGENTPQSQVCQLVMDHDQNLRELSVNVISLFTICVKRGIRE